MSEAARLEGDMMHAIHAVIRENRASLSTHAGRSRRACAPTCAALLLLLALAALLAACAPSAATANAATPPAVASPTPPAPTPTLPAGVAGVLVMRTRAAIGGLAPAVGGTYDAAKQAATITITVTGLVPMTDAQVAVAHGRVQQICYLALQALWASGEPLQQVTVIVVGPIQDEYATIETNWYGVAVVSAATARQIAWSRLDPASAWSHYDQHLLRTSYDLFD